MSQYHPSGPSNGRFYTQSSAQSVGQPINPFVYEAPVNDQFMEEFDRFATPLPVLGQQIHHSSNQSINHTIPLSTEDESDQSVDGHSVRRILTSPSALYQLPNEQYNQSRSQPMMSHHNKMYQTAYGQPVQQSYNQSTGWTETGYPVNEQPHGYYQPMNQPMHHPGVMRAVASSTSLSTMSPSSSASSVISMPPSINQAMNQSMSHSVNQSPYAADQGMRRIKSTPHMSINQSITPPVSGVKRKSSDINNTPIAASASSSQSTTSSTKPPQAKAARRLARKAEAARASRRKKKQYIHNLEDRVAKLTARLEAVQASNQSANQSNNQSLNPIKLGSSYVDTVHREEQQATKEKILTLLTDIKNENGGVITPSNNQSSSVSENSNESVDSSKLDDLKGLVDMFISASHKRGASLDVYMSLLSRSLQPSVPLKFVLWGLSQPDEFYAADGLWSGVMGREVGLSSEQMSTLLSQREKVTAALASLNSTMTQLNAVRTSMKQHLEDRQRVLEEASAALTPSQIASFCMWVQQNPLCMQMVESVWQQSPQGQKMM